MADAGRRNIVLTGFMGTGKTTVGRILAERLAMEFVDTDELIEERHGPIPEIFEQQGEARFREMEWAVAQELSDRRDLVIATGGHMMLDPRCAGALEPASTVVCLTADPRTVLGRIARPGAAQRPLLRCGDPYERVKQLLEERAAGYARFRSVDTEGLDPQEVADAVVDLTS